MARRFCQTNVPRNHSLIDSLLYVFLNRSHYLSRQIGAGIIHGEDDPLNIQRLVQALPHEINRVNQLAETFQRIILTLNRNQNSVRRHHGVDCQQT